MIIKRKRIRNIDKILNVIDVEEFYITTRCEETKVKEIGYTEEKDIIPNIIGPITRFNVLGKEIIASPRTKEVVTHMVNYSNTDWHGNPHSGTYPKKVERWKRVFIKPMNERIIVERNDDDTYTISTRIIYKSENKDTIKHLLNLLLEITNQVEIIDINKNPIYLSKRVPWKIVPPGEMPWEKYCDTIKDKIKDYDTESIVQIKDRYNFICSLTNNEMYTGEDGFSGYFIAELDNGIYIFDSIFLGNALYVVKGDWKEISKLSKKEILENNLAEERIIHTGNWKNRVLNIIK